MARRFGFKPPLRQTMLGHAAYLAAMAPGGKLPSDLAASLASTLPAAPKKRAAREGVDIDAIHGKRAAPRDLEGPVVKAIKQLVTQHPKILWILRVNSGSASYEAKSGKWAPVKFHEWLRYPEKMRMPDFYGMLIDGRSIALEAKKPGWSKPTDDREREQFEFLKCIRAKGGVAEFVRSAEEAQRAIEHG